MKGKGGVGVGVVDERTSELRSKHAPTVGYTVGIVGLLTGVYASR